MGKTSRSGSEATGEDDRNGLAPHSVEIVDRLRFGIIVTDSSGAVLGANEAAQEIVKTALGSWEDSLSCCSIFGCREKDPLAGQCLSELAAESPEPLPEIRLDVPGERPALAVWVTAARVDESASRVVMHLRPAAVGDRRRRTEPHWMGSATLHIEALGRTRVQTSEVPIEGDWLLQRPGQLLKFLVCERGRPVHVDEIAEALWPAAGVSGRNNVRHYVHALRDLLEPDRPSRTPSSFIKSIGSTYLLDTRVSVDVDRFDELVAAGLQSIDADTNAHEVAFARLEEAVGLYRGDLLSEEPFAEWAFDERERLRGLLSKALSHLVDGYVAMGDLATATNRLERAVDVQPLDEPLQRRLSGLLVLQGRHSDASRRFSGYRQRMLDEFGREPGYTLAEVSTEQVT